MTGVSVPISSNPVSGQRSALDCTLVPPFRPLSEAEPDDESELIPTRAFGSSVDDFPDPAAQWLSWQRAQWRSEI
jgi:hypothetical protein